MSDTVAIKTGSSEFTATLLDNETASAFKAMLPLTMDMTELNGNEKYFDLAESFPANPSNPEKINVGDLLLYGSKNIGALLQAIFIDIDPMGHQATPIR